MVGVLACAPLACGSLLGIDSGTPRGDASTTTGDDGASLSDVSTGDPPGDGGKPSDGAGPTDGGRPTDGGWPTDGGLVVDGNVGCTPDVNWCNTHCGTGPDNCNQMRSCNTPCPSGESCTSNVCTCTQDPNWCTGRCEVTTDNCGNRITCNECDGGPADCHSNVCNCIPDPVTTTCAGRQCGQVMNNCNLPVNCGANNTVNCSGAGICDDDAGTCCTPNNSACQGQCMTSIVTCGITVPCQSCAVNQVCVGTGCCTPSGCSGPCVDNCGQSNSACCPPPPPDGGPPPIDGGGCGGPGAPCPSPCCPGLMCGYNFQCVVSCEGKGAPCSQPSDCCYGLSCTPPPVVMTLSSPPPVTGGPDSGIVPPPSTCQ